MCPVIHLVTGILAISLESQELIRGETLRSQSANEHAILTIHQMFVIL